MLHVVPLFKVGHRVRGPNEALQRYGSQHQVRIEHAFRHAQEPIHVPARPADHAAMSQRYGSSYVLDSSLHGPP